MAEYTIDKIEYDSNVYKLQDNVSGYATLASPAFTGIPTAPTATSGDSSTQIATTAFVQSAMASAGAGTITAVKTTAGTHSTIDVSSGAANFNVPTNTSHLTNDSGFITSPNIPYLTCATAAATAAKTTTLVSGSFTANDLVAGAQVLVKFTNANGKASPTLSVNGTTAKAIMRYGTTAPSASASGSWNAGSVILFTYDGTYWQMQGWINTNTTYSEASVAEITSASNSTARLTSGRRTAAAVAAFESITDVTVDGTSVVSNRVAEITTSDNTFEIHVEDTTSGMDNYTLVDVTEAEVWAAYEAGKTLVLINDNWSEIITNYRIGFGEGYNDALPGVSCDVIWFSSVENYWAESFLEVGSNAHLYGIYCNDVDGIHTSGDIFYHCNEVDKNRVSFSSISTSGTYYPLVSSSTSGISSLRVPNGIDFYQYYNTSGGLRRLTLGNATAYKTTGGAYGTIRLYGTGATYYGDLNPGTIGDNSLTANRTWTLPDKTGTIALTDDIPTIPTITLNGSSTTSPSFYAPTSAGTDGYVLKSNGSGAPTWTSATLTDKKLEVAEVTSQTTYYPIVGTGTTASTRQYDTGGLMYRSKTNTNAVGYASLYLGNDKESNVTGSKYGGLVLYGDSIYSTELTTASLTEDRSIYLPNKTGTIALTSDIPTVPTITLNGSATTTPNFYAPTGAGTSGQYLKSSGSGAPTWTNFPTIPSITLNGSSTTSPSFYAPTSAGTSGYILTSSGSGAPSWIDNSKDWMYTNAITSTTITTVNSATKVPITQIIDSHGFTYDSTNKGIKCNKAGTYMVSCSLSVNPATASDLMGIQIYSNNSSIIGPEYNRVGGNYDIVILPPTPHTFANGDIITLYGKNNTSGRGTFTACRFSIWEV